MTSEPTGDDAVTHHADGDRYEIRDGGRVAGVALYRRHGDVVDFTHTEVDDAFAGRGLGRRLIEAALDDVRRRNLRVIPHCPFVAAFIADHPEYLHLVEQRHRHLVGTPAPGEHGHE